MQRLTDKKVEVLLATYNGEKYLFDFLTSLENQTFNGFKVLCRDDNSKDNTLEIIKDFKLKSFLDINIVQNNLKNQGVINNFSRLLDESTADYVLLADQDDVWHQSKIEDSIAAIQQLEHDSNGFVIPALVFTDLNIVDADLKLIHPSFINHQRLSQLKKPEFKQLLIQNVAPGCTMILNRSLLKLALPLPEGVAMHDWWLIQVASLFGKIECIDKSTIDYRQHGYNQVGANAFSIKKILKDIVNGSTAYRSRVAKSQRQARFLLTRYEPLMKKNDLKFVSIYLELPKLRPLYRHYIAWKHGFRKSGFLRNIVFFLYL